MPIHVNNESVSTHIVVCVELKQNPILNGYVDTDLHEVFETHEAAGLGKAILRTDFSRTNVPENIIFHISQNILICTCLGKACPCMK